MVSDLLFPMIAYVAKFASSESNDVKRGENWALWVPATIVEMW